jgi:hydroxyacylglutathione hydrolase
MHQTDRLEVHMFPCLSDNYGFLIHDHVNNLTATIDTPEVAAIEKALNENNWSLTHIINTHHHYDHAGGNLELKNKTGCTIIGPAVDQLRIPGIDQCIKHEETFQFGEHKIKAFHTPGHTLGHMVYHFEDQSLAFVGDTLFAMGCGRLFEGTPEQMWSSLSIIKQWPDNTKLYCAHEYTQTNANFAIGIEPTNNELIDRKTLVDGLRLENTPTVPTTVELEKKTNPFLRANQEQIKIALNMNESSDIAVFAEIRKRKDNF